MEWKDNPGIIEVHDATYAAIDSFHSVAKRRFATLPFDMGIWINRIAFVDCKEGF